MARRFYTPLAATPRRRDAAHEGFYGACKVATSQRRMGMDMDMDMDMRSPHRRRCYRTPTWKTTGIRVRKGALLWARARGLEPIRVPLPANLSASLAAASKQLELVWDRAGRHYRWHVTLEDGAAPAPAPGHAHVAVDLGEIHPAALTDGAAAVVITARRRRATHQYPAKRLAEMPSKQAGKKTPSRRWKRVQARTNRFLAEQKKRTRASEHKVRRVVVDWAKERKAGTLALGEVRDVADGTRLGAKSQQKMGWWSHGTVRDDIT